MKTYITNRIDTDWRGNKFSIQLFESGHIVGHYSFKTTRIEPLLKEQEKLESLGWRKGE